MLDVAKCTPEMLLAQWAGIKPVLPEMPRAAVHAVDVLRVDLGGRRIIKKKLIFAPGACNGTDVVDTRAVDQHLPSER